jgi:hypothetical protein
LPWRGAPFFLGQQRARALEAGEEASCLWPCRSGLITSPLYSTYL